MTEAMRHPEVQPSASDIRLVIAASSAGTVFEWYDFFIYGTLSAILSKAFFPAGSATLALLLFWLVFAVGFGCRPLGAILFGFLGDRLGRKYTFLVTVTLMGIATAGVGLVPSTQSIGLWAPAIVILLRILQGLALGGEYGGAAIYVAEHSPPERRGFYTGFIQASAVGGFVLSLVVVLVCHALMPEDIWQAWGWRVPFLLSIFLLLISLWMRMKLSESPVFRAMQEEGELAGNPFVESFTYPGNRKRIFTALFGAAAGMTVIWYTSMFYVLGFLQNQMHVEDTWAAILVAVAAGFGMFSNIVFGRVSDKVGRRGPMVVGYVLTLVLLFPLFWTLASAANPGLARASAAAPVVVSGPGCDYSPFSLEQATPCGKLLADLATTGISYRVQSAPSLAMTAGGTPIALDAYASLDKAGRAKMLKGELARFGYDFAKVAPTGTRAVAIVGLIFALMVLAGMTYGPMAALLTETFPARIRYSSMSIPYHIGTGYFGGFLPLIAAYIVARTGNPYAGLWYTWGVVAFALVVALWGFRSGLPRDFEDSGA